MMAFYGYQRQPEDYGFIATAGQQVAGAIQQYPQMKAAESEYNLNEDKRAALKDQLAQLKVDQAMANKIREERIVDAAVEYQEALGLTSQDGANEQGYAKAAQFYSPISGSEQQDPSKAILRWYEQDTRWKKFLEDKRIKAYQEETQTVPEPVPSGLAGRQAPGTVGVEDGGMKRTTPWQSVEEMQQRELNAPQVMPEVNREATSQEAYDIARKYRVAGVPEVKEDVGVRGQQELAGTYDPGTTQSQFAGQMLEKPVVNEPTQTAMKTLMTEKDQELIKNREAIARIRAEAQAERTKIAKMRAALQGRKLESDERLAVMKARDTAKAKLKALELVSSGQLKSVATTKNEFGEIDPDAVSNFLSRNTEITDELANLQNDIDQYEALLAQKDKPYGGKVAPEEPVVPKAGIPTFSDPNDPALRNLEKGAEFYRAGDPRVRTKTTERGEL